MHRRRSAERTSLYPRSKFRLTRLTLDAVDVRILRELIGDVAAQRLQTNPRRPYSMISKRLNISEDTLRLRVRRLYQSGFLRDLPLGLNPRVIGYAASFVFLSVDSERARNEVADTVRSLPGVLWIVTYSPPSVGFLLTYRTPEERDARISQIRPFARPGTLVVVDHTFPRVEGELRATDWRIVQALANAPRMQVAAVAARVGTTTRTVRRRLHRMEEGQTFYVFPDVNIDALSGPIPMSLATFYTDPEAKTRDQAKLLASFEPAYLLTVSSEPAYAAYVFLVPNLSVAERIRTFAGGTSRRAIRRPAPPCGGGKPHVGRVSRGDRPTSRQAPRRRAPSARVSGRAELLESGMPNLPTPPAPLEERVRERNHTISTGPKGFATGFLGHSLLCAAKARILAHGSTGRVPNASNGKTLSMRRGFGHDDSNVRGALFRFEPEASCSELDGIRRRESLCRGEPFRPASLR